MRRKKMDAADLDRLRSVVSMDRSAALATLGARDSDVEAGYSYQSMTGLSVLELGKQHFGARVFFDGDAVAVVALSEPSISSEAKKAAPSA